MIVIAGIKNITFYLEENTHTVKYAKSATRCQLDEEQANHYFKECVIAETTEQAIKILRKDAQRFLSKSLSDVSSQFTYKDFSFDMKYTYVDNFHGSRNLNITEVLIPVEGETI